MKNDVKVPLSIGYIILSRKQVEDAIAELNGLPRPFQPGEKVSHRHAPGAIFLVLDGRSLIAAPDHLWLANLGNGFTFQAAKIFLTHLGV